MAANPVHRANTPLLTCVVCLGSLFKPRYACVMTLLRPLMKDTRNTNVLQHWSPQQQLVLFLLSPPTQFNFIWCHLLCGGGGGQHGPSCGEKPSRNLDWKTFVWRNFSKVSTWMSNTCGVVQTCPRWRRAVFIKNSCNSVLSSWWHFLHQSWPCFVSDLQSFCSPAEVWLHNRSAVMFSSGSETTRALISHL